jgi:hypothetical protein
MYEWLGYLAVAGCLALGVVAFFGKRWAYGAFIVLGLLYFPTSVEFQFAPKPCEWTFGLGLAAFSLTNFPHVVLFALFFVMTTAQFRYKLDWRTFGWSMLAVGAMGFAVEFAEGLTGQHHCRMRDLIPDLAGGFLGAAGVFVGSRIWTKFRRRDGGRKRSDLARKNVVFFRVFRG